MTVYGLIDSQGRALIDESGRWLVTGGEVVEYRLLKDHYIEDVYLPAGATVSQDDFLPLNWNPTADVDPLTDTAVQLFYANGPALPGVINSQWQRSVIAAPITYWYQISPTYWALSGLGSDQTLYPPIRAFIGRIE